MSWATHHIEKLLKGETVKFRPVGNSMVGKIESGQLVTVAPLTESTSLIAGKTIVLCKVHGQQYLHLVSAIQGDRVQISNNKGYVNGWCSIRNVYGIVVNIED